MLGELRKSRQGHGVKRRRRDLERGDVHDTVLVTSGTSYAKTERSGSDSDCCVKV